MENKYQKAWQKICNYAYGNEELDSEYYEINAGWISRNRELTEEEINDVLTSY